MSSSTRSAANTTATAAALFRTNPKLEDLVEASRNSDETTASAILELGGVDVNGKGVSGSTPLVAAAESGSVELVRLLLQHKADPNLIVPGTGNSPLRAAIAGGDGACILCLLDAGADVNLETPRGTALTTAAALGDVSTIHLLAERGAALDHELRDGSTALLLAVREDQREAVKALLQCGADPALPMRDGCLSACDVAQQLGLAQVYGLLMQRSIVKAADTVLEEVDRRQQAARADRAEEAVRARLELQSQVAAARAESRQRISSLNAESDELMARLGISRPGKEGQGGGR